MSNGVLHDEGIYVYREPSQVQVKEDSIQSEESKPETSSANDVPRITRKRPPKLSRIQAVQSLDFDQLFEHPDQFSASIRRQTLNKLYVESVDEGIASFEVDVENIPAEDNKPAVIETKTGDFRRQSSAMLLRGDSAKEHSFVEILRKNWESSQGFAGFRRRIANDMNYKYCSYCRCDEVLFLFLYTVFGIVYICAGSLGLYHCSSEVLINLYLIVDGIMSIFIFPTTIMEWTKRIGGCINDDEKLRHGWFFITIITMRLIAGILGTVILLLRIDAILWNDIMCKTIFTLLKVGVVFEWMFLLLAVFIPMCFYIGVYLCARLCL